MKQYSKKKEKTMLQKIIDSSGESMLSLSNKLGVDYSNFCKRVKRGTHDFSEIEDICSVLGVKMRYFLEQSDGRLNEL